MVFPSVPLRPFPDFPHADKRKKANNKKEVRPTKVSQIGQQIYYIN